MQEGRGLLGGSHEAGTAQLAKKSIHGPEIAPLSSTKRWKWSLLQTVDAEGLHDLLGCVSPSPYSIFELAVKSLPVFKHAHAGRRDQHSSALPPVGSRFWLLLWFSVALWLDTMPSSGLFPSGNHPGTGCFPSQRNAFPLMLGGQLPQVLLLGPTCCKHFSPPSLPPHLF